MSVLISFSVLSMVLSIFSRSSEMRANSTEGSWVEGAAGCSAFRFPVPKNHDICGLLEKQNTLRNIKCFSTYRTARKVEPTT